MSQLKSVDPVAAELQFPIKGKGPKTDGGVGLLLSEAVTVR